LIIGLTQTHTNYKLMC